MFDSNDAREQESLCCILANVVHVSSGVCYFFKRNGLCCECCEFKKTSRLQLRENCSNVDDKSNNDLSDHLSSDDYSNGNNVLSTDISLNDSEIDDVGNDDIDVFDIPLQVLWKDSNFGTECVVRRSFTTVVQKDVSKRDFKSRLEKTNVTF